MTYHDAIARYYGAFRTRDLESVRALLTADFHFRSPFGEFRDRDAMLEAIWPSVGQTWATNLRVFGDGPELVVLYEHESAPSANRPTLSMAEHIRFEGERIAAIEVFVGRTLAPPPSR